MDCTRAEIFLCIISCCSETLFHPPERDTQPPPPPQEASDNVAPSKAYCSIVNKFLKYLVDIEEGCSHKHAKV